MAAQKWLNWSPESPKVLRERQNGTDKTDKNGVLSVLSVPSKPESKTLEASRTGSTGVSAPASRAADVVEIRPRRNRTMLVPSKDQGTAEALREIAGLLALLTRNTKDCRKVWLSPPFRTSEANLLYAGRRAFMNCS